MSMSASGSIQESSLGLTESELRLLRQQTEIATQTRSQGTAMPADRGRGTSRASQPSSRAASAASSNSIQGRVTMDTNSLSSLQRCLDTLMTNVSRRIETLEDMMSGSVQNASQRNASTIAAADREIERTKKIIAEIDRLDAHLEEIERVCQAVKVLRVRCDAAGGRLTITTLQRPTGGGPTARR